MPQSIAELETFVQEMHQQCITKRFGCRCAACQKRQAMQKLLQSRKDALAAQIAKLYNECTTHRVYCQCVFCMERESIQ